MASDEEERALVPATEVLPTANIDGLLARIRPEWQNKALIERVKRLLAVDPRSACQRLLNAAFHDLRQKVIIAVSLHGLADA
jgi:hypothetical protein